MHVNTIEFRKMRLNLYDRQNGFAHTHIESLFYYICLNDFLLTLNIGILRYLYIAITWLFTSARANTLLMFVHGGNELYSIRHIAGVQLARNRIYASTIIVCA